MQRRASIHRVRALLLVAAFLGGAGSAMAQGFVPPIRSQVPTAVDASGAYSTEEPNIAIAVGHSSSMIEQIDTGRSEILFGDVNETVPVTGCAPDSAACSCGGSGGGYTDLPSIANPHALRLYCRDSTLNPPENGDGAMLADVPLVNVYDEGVVSYTDYLTGIFPEIAPLCSTSICQNGAANDEDEILGRAYVEAFDHRGPGEPGPGDVAPAPPTDGDICSRGGLLGTSPNRCREILIGTPTPPPGTGDGIADRSVYPWDFAYLGLGAYDDSITPYTPGTAGGNDPLLASRARGFPHLDPTGDHDFNHPIRAWGGSTTAVWHGSKIRAVLCAVAAMAGVSDASTGCADDGFAFEDADSDNIDDRFESFREIAGGAWELGLFKTNQFEPGLYPPFDDDGTFNEPRENVSMRVEQYYAPGSEIALRPSDILGASPWSFGCDVDGDVPCDRSFSLLWPDVDRRGPGVPQVTDRYNDMVGLGRLVGDGAALRAMTVVPDSANDLDFIRVLDERSGIPGGALALSAVIRDAYSPVGADLPDAIGAAGIFADDANDCGTSNALILIIDALDSGSATDATCTSTAEPAANRVPGYDPTASPSFDATCADARALAARATAKEMRTYVIGLDADWGDFERSGANAIAAAGDTGAYYSARSFDEVATALESIFLDVKFRNETVIPAGVPAITFGRVDSPDEQDYVIDTRYDPETWAGFLFSREIVPGSQPVFAWEAGELLRDRNIASGSSPRSALTTMDVDCNGIIGGDTSASDEIEVFGVGNANLVNDGGHYVNSCGSVCASSGGTETRCELANAHDTGPPFFLDSSVNPLLGLSNRDGNAVGLVAYTLGFDDPLLSGVVGAIGPLGGYRSRDFDGNGTWRLADAANASPVPVGPSLGIAAGDVDTDGDGFSDFEEYQEAIFDRPRLVYQATNGGSVHAFNVDGTASAIQQIKVRGTTIPAAARQPGGEVFVLWPNEILQRLKRYSNPTYGQTDGFSRPRHEDGIDLTPRIVDAKLTGSDCSPSTDALFCWRTVMILGMRNGGHSYIALDITDPTESLGISDVNHSGTAYAFPTLLWDFAEYKDDGHDRDGNLLAAVIDPANCDTDAERDALPECEDNGIDDGDASQTNVPSDRIGKTWSTPLVTRSRETGDAIIYFLSGPDTVDGASVGQGYLWGLRLSDGAQLDVTTPGGGAGGPLAVADANSPSAGSAGAVDVAATPLDTADDVAPFRTSIVGADLTPSDDLVQEGTRADVLYWGDLAGRLWRGVPEADTDAVSTRVLFYPGSTATAVDVGRPIVSRPTLTPAQTQFIGAQPDVWVVFGDGSLHFNATDLAQFTDVGDPNPGYPANEVESDLAFRVYSVLDDPDGSRDLGAGAGSADPPAYFDDGDESDCPSGSFVTSSCSNGSGSGDLDDTTCGDNQVPFTLADGLPSGGGTAGGFFQCLQNNIGGALADSLGSDRIIGSPFIFNGAVVVEAFRPTDPAAFGAGGTFEAEDICYNVGTTSILAYDYETGGLVDGLGGSASVSGSDPKYFIAPPSALSPAPEGFRVVGAPPDGYPPEFIRYHLVEGAEAPVAAIPLDTIYWQEPF